MDDVSYEAFEKNKFFKGLFRFKMPNRVLIF